MDKKELRDALMHQLWRMNKMDLMVNMREYLEGESAALNYLYTCGDARVTPSQISESINVSRARMANILRSLRGKKYIEMEMSEHDRRKMDVYITPAGKEYCKERYDYLVRYFDLYVDVLGEDDIKELTRLIRKTADNEVRLKK